MIGFNIVKHIEPQSRINATSTNLIDAVFWPQMIVLGRADDDKLLQKRQEDTQGAMNARSLTERENEH